MGDNEIIANNVYKLVYCHIKYNGRVYMALADQINRRYFLGDPLYDIFPIQLIYSRYDISEVVAEYAFIYDRIRGSMELETINMYQFAINNIEYTEDTGMELDENVISKELALEMYNKFKDVYGCK